MANESHSTSSSATPGTAVVDIIDDRMPASRRDHHTIKLPATTVHEYLKDLQDDLSVHRIDKIHAHLWLVGRPYPPRPLSTQKVLDREIIPTADASLHLVWTSGRIYVKAIPPALLSDTFYDRHLKPSSRTVPVESALGLLYSYIALLPTELDFESAQKANLLPQSYRWRDWKRLVYRILSDYDDILQEIPKRYEYGELRLDRLDKIYRYLCGDLLHGYSRLTGSTRYVDFFSKNIAVIGASTVYLVVIITAMALGRTTKALKNNDAFDAACYGFAVFAIFLPLAGIALTVAVFLFMFISNYLNTRTAQDSMRRERAKPPTEDLECEMEDFEMQNVRSERLGSIEQQV